MFEDDDVMNGGNLEAPGKTVSGKCGAPTARGGVCTVGRVAGFGHCFQHLTVEEAPQLVEQRALKRREGGRNATLVRWTPEQMPDPDLSTQAAVRRLVSQTMGMTRRGELPATVANSLYLGVAQILRMEEMVQDATLRDMERKIEAYGKQRGWQ